MIRRPPRSTLSPTRRSPDLVGEAVEGARRRRAADPIDRVEAAHQEIALGAKSRHHASDRILRSREDRKSTRLNSSHGYISYAVFCLKKKNKARRPACTSTD